MNDDREEVNEYLRRWDKEYHDFINGKTKSLFGGYDLNGKEIRYTCNICFGMNGTHNINCPNLYKEAKNER